MCPPPRSLAVEANGCFMVRVPAGPTEYKVAARVLAPHWRAPLGFVLDPVARLSMRRKRSRPGQHGAVLAAVSTAWSAIKAHKLHLASGPTSCTKATANQFRLLIHTAAYWLMLALRGVAPRTSPELVEGLARCPVRHDPPLPDQSCRAGHGDGHPYQARAADLLPLSGRRCR